MIHATAVAVLLIAMTQNKEPSAANSAAHRRTSRHDLALTIFCFVFGGIG